ncbi:MAG: hypothetical protein E7550_02935 [Ruminococcaceae bacterium]|nr:hypothetical protein [Oscillospiraceae bacterium]
MYPEFVPIYVGLIITIALLVVILIVLLKKGGGNSATPKSTTSSVMAAPAPSGNVVFCKNCAAEFDAAQRCCPKCGTPR